jgi:hypothetical protein
MKNWLRFFVVILTLILYTDIAMNQPLKITENLRSEQVVLPPVTPDKGRMAQTDRRLFFEAGGAAGILVFYDDARTKPATDYIEFFDLQGNLLLVSWIDRAGICQAAMDDGLFDPNNPKVEKVLVIVTMGTAL